MLNRERLHNKAAPKEQQPGNSQAKGPKIVTLESRLGLTEGVNLSGK